MALDYKLIGQRLKKARILQNLTQDKLAEKLNVSVAYLSRIETGSIRINLPRLNEICTELKITEASVLSGTSENAGGYLSAEFSELLKHIPTEKQKLLYKIGILLAEE